MRNNVSWPLQRELWSLKKLQRPKEAINGSDAKLLVSEKHLFMLLSCLEACIHYAMRIVDAKHMHVGVRSCACLYGVPSLRSCVARSKRARPHKHVVLLVNLGHALHSEGIQGACYC